jgi:NADPH:quinone reductase-like Zn-dependent oxidoreductase
MKSAQIKRYGGSEVVEINQNTPAPNDPSADNVLVRIKAAGVNPVDENSRRLHATNDATPIPVNLGNGFFRCH